MNKPSSISSPPLNRCSLISLMTSLRHPCSPTSDSSSMILIWLYFLFLLIPASCTTLLSRHKSILYMNSGLKHTEGMNRKIEEIRNREYNKKTKIVFLKISSLLYNSGSGSRLISKLSILHMKKLLKIVWRLSLRTKSLYCRLKRKETNSNRSCSKKYKLLTN